MECMNKCGKEAASNSKYCGKTCRALYSRKRNKGAAQQGATPEAQQTFTDACGNVHQIDYEGRNADVKMLESWAKSEQSTYQSMLGRLALYYSIINGFRDVAGRFTAQGRRYLNKTA